eukprot:9737211-Heterocapsa_arctica.AAC.1
MVLRALAKVELLEMRLQLFRLGERLRVGLLLEQALQLLVVAETVDGVQEHACVAGEADAHAVRPPSPDARRELRVVRDVLRSHGGVRPELLGGDALQGARLPRPEEHRRDGLVVFEDHAPLGGGGEA